MRLRWIKKIRKERAEITKIKRPIAAFALLLIAGIFIWNRFVPEADLPYESYLEDGQQISVSGVVYRQESGGDRQLLYIKEVYIHADEGDLPVRHLLAYQAQPQEIKIGNTISLTGKLKIPERSTNPGQFDSRSYYQSQKIDYLLYETQTEIIEPTVNYYMQALYSAKMVYARSLENIIGQEDASVLKAMLLGDKRELDARRKSMYEKNGIAHILAVSGLHVSLLGSGCFWLLKKTRMPGKAAAIAGMIWMISYGFLIGFPVSAVRAVLMFCLTMGAFIAKRTYDRLSALSLAAIFILLGNPLSLFQASFLLSFGAILSLVFIAPVLMEYYDIKNKIGKALCVSFSIQAGTLPVLLFFFYQYSIYGIFLNLLVIPLMTFVLLFGLLAGFAGLFSVAAGNVIVTPCYYILKLYDLLCDLADRLPFSQICAGSPKLWQIACYYGVLAAVLLWMRYGAGWKRWWVMSGLAIVLCLNFSFFSIKIPEGLQISFLDVGQGDGIFIKTTEGMTGMIDGGSTNVSSVGQYRILPFLKYQGITKLDFVVITHADADHYNGIKEIMLESEEVGLELLVLPELTEKDSAYEEIEVLAGEKGIDILYLGKGNQIILGDLVFTCLHPDSGFQPRNKNDGSIVLEMEYRGFNALFTGDLEELGETYLVGSEELQVCDLLKVAHHGSGFSTNEPFLEKVQPNISVISCAKKNSYGHPHGDVLRRLDESGSRIYLTMESGAVTMRIRDGKMSVEEWVK